ncbi:MAG: BrnT family toxin [Pyrinomonadaceae bacterium]|nr:BrnT family toxin [Pyrinomonadaceae bacterium]
MFRRLFGKDDEGKACVFKDRITLSVSIYECNFDLQGIEFEWDEEKYAVNLRKHNVKFENAVEVFFDELCQFGDASVAEESREFIIGFTFDFNLLFTVFVERGERFRIISVRPATFEEEQYYARKK